VLSAGDANYDRRNVFHINERVEIFRAGQIRKVDDIVSHLRDFASHFFSGPQVQLHTFTGTVLKDSGDARISLQAGLVLGQRGGAGYAAWGRAYKGIVTLVDERVPFIAEQGLYTYAATQIDWINAAAVIFALGCVWPVYRRFGVPFALMIVVTVLPPLFVGGFLSMGRITSTLFPIFLWLGTAVPERHHGAWVTGFAMVQALCAIVFFTWRPLY